VVVKNPKFSVIKKTLVIEIPEMSIIIKFNIWRLFSGVSKNIVIGQNKKNPALCSRVQTIR
jgi:hypothetical protein